MFYMYGGKIYAPRNENGAITFDIMTVQAGDGGAPHIVNAGGSEQKLPSGAIPMTNNEVLARFPASPAKTKRVRKAVTANVPDE